MNAFRLTKDWEAFLLSPRNADEATISLMRSTNCVKYVTAEQSLDQNKDIYQDSTGYANSGDAHIGGLVAERRR
jgi:hypothetical protein